MTDSGSRRGAANLGPILMILSFAAMGGFLWWLNMTAEGTEPVVMEEEAEADTADEATAMFVTRNRLRMDTDSLVGHVIRIENVAVASTLGENAFLLELGEAEQSSAFLVVLDSALMASSPELPQDTATVVGTVRVRTDSVMEAWIGSGVIPEGDRPIVEFSSHYVEARRVGGPGMPPAEDEEAGGAEDEEGGGDGGGGGA